MSRGSTVVPKKCSIWMLELVWGSAMRFGSGFVGFPGCFSSYFVDLWSLEGGPGAVFSEELFEPDF